LAGGHRLWPTRADRNDDGSLQGADRTAAASTWLRRSETEATIGVTVLNRMLAAGRPNSDRRRHVLKRRTGTGVIWNSTGNCTNAPFEATLARRLFGLVFVKPCDRLRRSTSDRPRKVNRALVGAPGALWEVARQFGISLSPKSEVCPDCVTIRDVGRAAFMPAMNPILNPLSPHGRTRGISPGVSKPAR
jgi:hypothetical protein